MRQLSKIIFINSASIRYQEIGLDGNIHFIGTQGVGKSTLLRAILFFYNADTGKLGIPSGKQSYAEYYFKNSNSSIIYEVKGETSNYCILTYKQSGRVAYRFIDSPYKIEHYIKDNLALDPWDKIRANLDQAGIYYSNKVERYEEYRNILYGNFEGRTQFRKYALFESKLFQNIPRTIQNVFLNSKLEADFIKKTIIDSLSEENFEIDLSIYRHHLSDFENEYKDINTFKNKKTLEKVEKILLHYNQILKAKADKRENLLLLDQAAAIEALKQPTLEKTISEIKTKLANKQAVLAGMEKEHGVRIDKITGEKGELEGKKKDTETKIAFYKEKNIEAIIERVAKKKQVISRKEALEKELGTILTAYANIDEKYKALQERLQNNFNESQNALKLRKVDLKEEFQRFSEVLIDNFNELEQEIRTQYKARLDEAYAMQDQCRTIVNDLEKEEIKLRTTRYYEKEIEGLKHQIAEKEKLISQKQNDVKHKTAEKLQLQKELENEKEKLETNYRFAAEKVSVVLKAKHELLEKLSLQINSSSKAFFGYLNMHYPGWENTIGKVCREEIIFNNELSPELIEASSLIFGVKLELDNVEIGTKTLEGYEQEKAELEEEIKGFKSQAAQLHAEKEAEVTRISKKYVQKSRTLIDEIQIQNFETTALTDKVQQEGLDLKELMEKAEIEKRTAIDTLTIKLASAKQQYETVKRQAESLIKEQDEQIAIKRSEKNLKVDEAESVLNKSLKAIEEEIIILNGKLDHEKIALQNAKHDELEGKGLDTSKLKVIEKSIETVKQELQFIEQHYDLTVQYKNDKREYIDKLEIVKANIILKEEEIASEKEKYTRQKAIIITDLTELNSKLDQAVKALNGIQEQLETYKRFIESKEYEKIENNGVLPPVPSNFTTITSYIETIRESHYAIIDQSNHIATASNDFIGRFNHNNIFNFKAITEDDGYLQFAQILREFIDEQKLNEFEKRVNKRYADIIQIVSTHTSDLMSKAGEIQRVINKINQDFKEKIFVGAVSLIEMRIEDGTNRIVEVLRRIKEFNAANEYTTFGGAGPNLFSDQADEKRITEAIDLLTHLVNEIKNSKNTVITISDSFELKFRVIENQNDSGWVEKLSNVGSEGTDILVKAMINIMLLNVFKENASKKMKDFRLHCMMDEIGRLHPANVRGILQFANDRNILLINGSPIEHDALAYKHIYELRKDQKKNTRVKRLISSKNETITAIS